MSECTTRQILDMIEVNEGREGLDLSGKDLSGIDLSYEAIQREVPEVQALDLREMPDEIAGINLSGANLQGANLRESNLQEAFLEEANLQWANLWRANLQEANLLVANLQEAELGRVNLQGAVLVRANLQGAFLMEANLREAYLSLANLQEAYLDEANLQGANLGGTNLQGAVLVGANLTRVDLLGTKSIEGISLYRATLNQTQLTKDQLGGAIGEELRGEWYEAREAYLALKNNFEQIGRYDDAAWAYRKERRMEKLEALQKARRARKIRKWKEAARNYAKVAGDQLVELVCDYGESIGRVLGTMAAVWPIFALIYRLIAGVWGPWQEMDTGQIRYITRNPVHLLAFSLGAMTTLEPVGLEARPMIAMQFLVPLQALVGIALAGLLGFVAGNRIRRS